MFVLNSGYDVDWVAGACAWMSFYCLLDGLFQDIITALMVLLWCKWVTLEMYDGCS